jgi:adenosine deaminase
MSIASFVQAIPKVELNLQFEGALPKDTLLLIAEQNDIPLTQKNYKQWVAALDKPEYSRLDDLVKTIVRWIQVPDDLTRLVYDLGVGLGKQNIRYAEVSINPLLYTDNGFTFEQLLTALNDGRNRLERAWQVQLGWVLNINRNDVRRADDVVRWATSAAGRKGGIVGVGLIGREEFQSASDFERPIKTAQKKSLPCAVHTNVTGEEIQEIIQHLEPHRIVGGFDTATDSDAIREKQIAFGVCVSAAVRLGYVTSYTEFPLRKLVDDGLLVHLCSEMPSLYKTSLTQEMIDAVEKGGFSIREMEELSLNALRASALPDDEKAAMLEKFAQDYVGLRDQHEVTLETSAP